MHKVDRLNKQQMICSGRIQISKSVGELAHESPTKTKQHNCAANVMPWIDNIMRVASCSFHSCVVQEINVEGTENEKPVLWQTGGRLQSKHGLMSNQWYRYLLDVI